MARTSGSTPRTVAAWAAEKLRGDETWDALGYWPASDEGERQARAYAATQERLGFTMRVRLDPPREGSE